jgi:4-amino-4-deoxy-L-arabinose transferase-like glycosyltransferase
VRKATKLTVISASWRAALAGALVAALATLPGLGAGTLWDNSETAYGEVAREILISHSWIVMHLNGVPWFVQPPLYFWIAALCAKVLGSTEFAFRLPSALATIAMSAATGYAVARVTTLRAAVLSAIVLSTSLMQAVLGRLAIMDALLDLAVSVAILSGFGALRTGGRRLWYAAWIALAFGTLAKGLVAPVVWLIVVVPWALWDRAAGRRPLLPSVGDVLGGLVLFGALVLPWPLTLARAAGLGALGDLVGHYTVGRYLGTIENQSGPVWYYVPVLILGFFPWFPFLVPAAAEAWRDARGDARGGDSGGSLARLALVWTVVPFVFFSLAQTKLPNYVALTSAPLAILVAVWFDRVAKRRRRRSALLATAVVPVLILLLALAAAVFSRDNKLSAALPLVGPPLAALGGAICAGSIACFALLRTRSKAWLGPVALGAASVLVMTIIAVVGVPIVERFKPIPPLAAVIERERRPGDVVAVQSVSGGNGLMFYTRPGIAILNGPGVPRSKRANDPRRTICAASRALVVAPKKRPRFDPTYGRTRRVIATSNNDILFLYDGPGCAE